MFRPQRKLILRFSVVVTIGAIAFLIQIGSLFAIIGETEEACTSKYGSPSDETPIAPANAARGYTIGSWHCIIEFWQGIAQAVIYTKVNQSPITQSNVQQIVIGASEGAGWTPDERLDYTFGFAFTYIRSDNRMYVYASTQNVAVYAADFFKAVINMPAGKAMQAHRETLKAELEALVAEQRQIEHQYSKSFNRRDWQRDFNAENDLQGRRETIPKLIEVKVRELATLNVP